MDSARIMSGFTTPIQYRPPERSLEILQVIYFLEQNEFPLMGYVI